MVEWKCDKPKGEGRVEIKTVKGGLLDLSLNIDNTVRFSFRLLEEQASLASQQPYSPVPFLEQLRGRVIEDETCGLLIGLKPQFFRDESYIYIRLITVVSR